MLTADQVLIDVRGRASRLGVPATVIALEAGLPHAHVCKILAGTHNNPTVKTIDRIVAAIGRIERESQAFHQP
jgi:predicted transcriptional regulator